MKIWWLWPAAEWRGFASGKQGSVGHQGSRCMGNILVGWLTGPMWLLDIAFWAPDLCCAVYCAASTTCTYKPCPLLGPTFQYSYLIPSPLRWSPRSSGDSGRWSVMVHCAQHNCHRSAGYPRP
jgi:hypothetical protein